MSTAPGRRRIATGLLALATAASVSACGASLEPETYQQDNNWVSSAAGTGDLALRNIAVEAPRTGEAHEVGDDVEVTLTVTNSSDEEDRLVEVTSSVAEEVVVLAGGEERDLVVPGRGSTGDFVTLELRGLTRPLRSGEYVDLTLRFADNGSTQVLVPVNTGEKTDRPVYTGERFEGGEEPALQAPAGGHHGEGEEHGDESTGGKGGGDAAGDAGD